MQIKLIVATQNKNKLNEIQSKIAQYNFNALSYLSLSPNLNLPPETGSTFEENARIKAEFIHRSLHMPVVSDDSGLLVEALHNEPGVYSARYAGLNASDEMNIEKLLANMKNQTNRKAAFVTVLAFTDGQNFRFFEGRVNGLITTEKLGKNGFGYDPIFIPEGCSKTFAQMEPEEKNQYSHRALAVNKLVDFLQNYTPQPE